VTIIVPNQILGNRPAYRIDATVETPDGEKTVGFAISSFNCVVELVGAAFG